MNEMPFSNQPVDEMTRLAQAAREALTDQMIERFAVTGGNALELLDRLNDETTSAAVHSLIDRLTEMHKVGALNTACDMVMLLHAARSAVTDSMVERLFMFVENLTGSISHNAVGDMIQNTCHALEEAAADSAKAPESAGMLSTLSLLRKPETQRSLQFLLAFAGKLRSATCGPTANSA
jgi:uncharacterized protein YjgD (DUF1641 family)